MPAQVNITYSLATRWREIEADGQHCYTCHDQIFLHRAWLLGLFFGDTEIAIRERYYLCDSCHEFVTQHYESKS